MRGFNCKVGSIDILVNNAGMTSQNDPLGADEASDLTGVTLEAWQRGMKRNLDTALISQNVLCLHFVNQRVGESLWFLALPAG